jgi:hypothetical protein
MKQLQLEGRHTCGCSATPSQSILINYESGGVPPPGRKREDVRDRAGKAVEVAKQGRWSYHQSRQSRHKKTEFPPPMAGISYLRSEVMNLNLNARRWPSWFIHWGADRPSSQLIDTHRFIPHPNTVVVGCVEGVKVFARGEVKTRREGGRRRRDRGDSTVTNAASCGQRFRTTHDEAGLTQTKFEIFILSRLRPLCDYENMILWQQEKQSYHWEADPPMRLVFFICERG